MNPYQIGKRFKIQIPSEERYYSSFAVENEGRIVEIIGYDQTIRGPGRLYILAIFVENNRQYNFREEELRPIKGILSTGERIL